MARVQGIPLGALAVGFALNYDNIIKVFCILVRAPLRAGGRTAESRAKVSARVFPKWPAFISCCLWPQQQACRQSSSSLRVDAAEGFSNRFSATASPPIFPLTCRATRTHAERRPNNAPLARACLIVVVVIVVIIYEPEPSE